MQTSMWMRAMRGGAIGVICAASVLLAACGGDGSDEPMPLEVAVTVDGVADVANPVEAGELTEIEVPSGATVVLESASGARWSASASDATYAVETDTATRVSIKVHSNAGGEVVLTLRHLDDADQTATLRLVVGAQRFDRTARVDGEMQEWKITYVTGQSPDPFEMQQFRQTVVFDDGNWGENYSTTGLSEDVYSRAEYNAEDASLGTTNWFSADCMYAEPLKEIQYPMHVGRTWSGSAVRECADGRRQVRSHTYSVAAYEQVSVPAGQFDALRVDAMIDVSVPLDSAIPAPYTYTKVCWWAPSIGRFVKCEFEFAYPDGTPLNYNRWYMEEMVSRELP